MQLSDSLGLELITRCIDCSQPACCVAKEMFEDLMIKLMHQKGHKKQQWKTRWKIASAVCACFVRKARKKKSFESIT